MNIPPPNGHVFVDTDGTEIKARSWFGVFRKLKEYRRRAGRDEGQPVTEVFDQVCSKHPDLCYEDAAMPVNRPGSLKGRVFSWLAGVRKHKNSGNPIALVSPAVAQQRQAICLRCPFHSDVGSGCATCKGALRGLRADIIGDRSPRSARVGACGSLGIDLPVATNLDEPAIEHAPVHCWRRRTL